MKTVLLILFTLSACLGFAQSTYILPWAANNSHTCTQGNNGSTSHFGIDQYAYDFSMPIGTSIRAMRSGVVIHITQSFPNNNCPCCPCSSSCINNVNRIVIQHSDGSKALYLHLSPNSVSVSCGQSVSQGQIIALSGNSGCSTNPHLHVAVMSSGACNGYCNSPWYCQSIPFSFCDVTNNNGVPTGGNSYTAGNCSSADLFVVNQTLGNSSIAAGGNIVAYCAEDNSGTASSTANIVSIYLSPNSVLTPGMNGDTYLGFINFSGLSPNSNSIVKSTSIQVPISTPPGNYYIFFWADGGQVVNESNETNNFATKQLTVTSSVLSYTITASPLPTIGGIASGSGSFPAYQLKTVTATSGGGYSFTGWKENNNTITTNPSYTFTLTSNRNLQANFTTCNYTLGSTGVNINAPSAFMSFWVYTTFDCGWTAVPSSCNWITMLNSTGTGNGMVTFNVSANTSTSSRSCTINVGGKSFILTQNGYVPPCSNAPSTPSSLSASTIASNKLYLSWGYNSLYLTHFELERSLSPTGPFSLIATVPTSTFGSFSDSNVTGGTNYYYRVRSCCNSNCSNYSSVAFQKACTFSEQPTGVVSSADTICAGDSVLLVVQGGHVGTGAYWKWTSTQCSSGPLIDTGKNWVRVAPMQSGYYCVRPEGGGCWTSMLCACKYIAVKQPPIPDSIYSLKQLVFCPGDSITLYGNTNGTWSTGDMTDSIVVKSGGDYFVTNTNSCAIITSNHLLVTSDSLNVSAGANTVINIGDTINLGANPVASGKGPFTFIWTPSLGLDTAFIANPKAFPSVNTNYVLTVIDANGCAIRDSVLITVNPVSIPHSNEPGHIRIYPNPTNNNVTVEGRGMQDGKYNLVISNTIGQVVFDDTFFISNNKGNKVIQFSELGCGVYYLVIKKENIKMAYKIVRIL